MFAKRAGCGAQSNVKGSKLLLHFDYFFLTGTTSTSSMAIISLSRRLSSAAFGTGNTSWHFNAGDFGPEHPRHACAYGLLQPSRPDLVWYCPHFSELRGATLSAPST